MVALVPQELLTNTPSREHGISRRRERLLRSFGAELILRAVVLLRLPQVTGCTAAAIFQRFFFRRSFAEFDVQATAAAALFLACKLEETQRRVRDVIVVFHRLQMRALVEDGEAVYAGSPVPALSLDSHEFAEAKQEVASAERHILRALGFAVAGLLEHPHKYVLQFVKSLRLSSDWLSGELAQQAWSYLNDSLRTPLCCSHQPHQIATAGIQLAARRMGLKLPQEPPWWEVFDADPGEMAEIARLLTAVYALPSLQYVSAGTKERRPLRSPSTPFPDTPGTPLPTPLPSPAEDCRSSSARVVRRESSLDESRIGELLGDGDARADAGRSRSRSRSRSAGKKRVVRLALGALGSRPAAPAQVPLAGIRL
uniref:Cyclin-like domain-containing protein n=1 Tax=Alexandrium monilatum TaxID=311494 RepID=A0A7S4RMV5_9DINO|mmetsp:Transcript_58173/g.180488  ORF Transcript_58173/g.180488 Transcript_58173/m.180488 type:complete len:369 (+) Transcript_58173:88-1194(+)